MYILDKLSLFGGATTEPLHGVDSKTISSMSVVDAFKTVNSGVEVTEIPAPSRYLFANSTKQSSLVNPKMISDLRSMYHQFVDSQGKNVKLGDKLNQIWCTTLKYNPVAENPYYAPPTLNHFHKLYEDVFALGMDLSEQLSKTGLKMKVDKRSGIPVVDNDYYMAEIRKGYKIDPKAEGQIKEMYDEISLSHNFFDNFKKFSIQVDNSGPAIIQPYKGRISGNVHTLNKYAAIIEQWVEEVMKRDRFWKLLDDKKDMIRMQFGRNGGWYLFSSVGKAEFLNDAKYEMAVAARGKFSGINWKSDDIFPEIMKIYQTLPPNEMMRRIPGAMMGVQRTRTANKTAAVAVHSGYIREVIGLSTGIAPTRSAYGTAGVDNSIISPVMPYLEALKNFAGGRNVVPDEMQHLLSNIAQLGNKAFFISSDASSFDLNFPGDTQDIFYNAILSGLKTRKFLRQMFGSLRHRHIVFQHPDNMVGGKRAALVAKFGLTMMPSGAFDTPIGNWMGMAIPGILSKVLNENWSIKKVVDMQEQSASGKELPLDIGSGDDTTMVSTDLKQMGKEFNDKSLIYKNIGVTAEGALTDNFLRKSLRYGRWNNNIFRSSLQNIFGPENPPESLGIANLAAMAKVERIGINIPNDFMKQGSFHGYTQMEKDITVKCLKLSSSYLKLATIKPNLGIAYFDELAKWEKSNINSLKDLRTQAESQVMYEMMNKIGMKSVKDLLDMDFNDIVASTPIRAMLLALESNKHSPSGEALMEAILSSGLREFYEKFDNAKNTLARKLNEIMGITYNIYDIVKTRKS